MAKPNISLLSTEDLNAIHDASLRILKDTGVMVLSTKALEALADFGVKVDRSTGVARIAEKEVQKALDSTTKQYEIYGRNGDRRARYGHGDQNMISSPGQYAWFDHLTGERRSPILQDARLAAFVADALPNITIVGAMSVPTDVPYANSRCHGDS